MADRQRAKSWTNSTDQELLGEHEKLVKRLQDPAYAGIDPSTTKDAPMHVLDRGTLASLESELSRRGVTYTPAQGRVTPMPVAPRGPRPTINTPAASTTPPTPTPAPAPSPDPATIHGQPADQVPKHLGGTLEPGAAIPQNIPQQPTLPPHLTGQTAPAQPVTPRPQPAATGPTKPIGKPVTSVTASVPPPTGAGAQQVSGQMTAAVQDTTNFSKNTTPGKMAAVVEQNAPPKSLTSGAPTPRPLLKKTGDDISKALLGGTKGTRNIKLAGAAALLGLGAYTVNKKSHQTNDDYDRKLEMQRRGMMM